MSTCTTGKRRFATEELAVQALIEAHSVYHYQPGQGPQSVYVCDECGDYHFTSRGPMNAQLKEAIESGRMRRAQQANQWKEKFR